MQRESSSNLNINISPRANCINKQNKMRNNNAIGQQKVPFLPLINFKMLKEYVPNPANVRVEIACLDQPVISLLR